jgi:serine/threonine protein kinase
VLKALRFAHERRSDDGRPLNLVHCDISPHNVLISHAGEVKITDFGISRAAFQVQSLHEAVRGKYAYMSPEQIENQARWTGGATCSAWAS